MRILFLDDMQHRHEQFKSKYDDGINIIDFIETAQGAIDLLTLRTYDAIFLDHDLNNTYFAPSDETSGYAVASWIGENINYSPIIIIHSMNPAGSIRMCQKLKEYNLTPILAPFTCIMGTY